MLSGPDAGVDARGTRRATRVLAPRSWVGPVPAVALVVTYLVLLLCVPSSLVVGSLGAPGAPASIVGVVALLWWVCATVGGHNPVRSFTPLRLAVALLVVAVLAAYANGMAGGWWAPPSMRQSTDDIYSLVSPSVGEVADAMVRSADRGLLTLAGWLGILLLTADGLRSWKDLDLVVTALTWLAGVVAALAILQFFTGIDIASYFQIPGLRVNSEFGGVSSRSVLNRPSATATHPIELGVVLAGIAPLALHRTIHRWGEKLALLPTAAVLVAVFMTVSRSAVLVVVVALLVMASSWPGAWRARALVIAPVSLVALRLAVPGLVGTIVSLFRNFSSDPSITGRTDDYDVVLQLFADHAVLGRGMFTFQPRYYRILDNQYLTTMLELGYVGLGAVVLLLLVGFACARGVHRRAGSAEHRHLGLALAGAILGTAVSYLTFDAWSFPMAAGTGFVLLGLSGAAWRAAQTDAGAAGAVPR